MIGIKDAVKIAAIKKIYSYLEKDPETAMVKIVDLLDRFDVDDGIKRQRDVMRDVVRNPESNWHKFILGIYDDIDREVIKKVIENLVINANVIANPKAIAAREKYQCNIPWAILMDPTTACNLKCTGCWAAEYGNHMSMSFDELDDIIRQGKELGIMMYIFSGGEPLVRKDDIIKLCEKHNDAMFLAFTNGILIDEKFASDMLRVKNFVPAISVEGFEDDTDFRRGEGTFKKVEAAMALLKEKKLPFGISCCYTSKNCESIGSEAYFDQMIEWGAKFCWFFTYMPVGDGAASELIATDKQREWMYYQIRKFRETKPLFTIDFWNDGEFVGGCIAGGRRYLHINAGGDIEPCAFVHYSDSNIREKSLVEAFKSPLFMAYHDGQPFNDNLLRPCPILDNPDCIVDMVHKSGAHSTEYLAPEEPEKLAAKTRCASEAWAKTADEIWKKYNLSGKAFDPKTEEVPASPADM